MSQKMQRGRRRGKVKDAAKQATPEQNDRYSKFLPEWMRNGAGAPQRPPRPRRPRQQKSAGGYTPGKFALDDAR